jgi:Mg2+/citrate symporter
MMKNGSDEHIDRLLDEMLALYSVVEPRSGLEGRILANLRSKPSRTPWFWLIPAATVAMVLILTWSLGMGRRPEQKIQTVAKTEVRAPSTTAKRRAAPPITAGTLRARRKTASRSLGLHSGYSAPQGVAVPRLEQFPTPLPETEQERLLKAYVQRASKTDLKATKLLQGPVTELKIRNLSVTKLRISELDNTWDKESLQEE